MKRTVEIRRLRRERIAMKRKAAVPAIARIRRTPLALRHA
jgi:hypothetical protein